MAQKQPVSGFSDLRDIWRIIVRRRWLIILPFVVVTLVTYAGSFLLTPEFESSTIVAINPQMRLSGDLQRLLGTSDVSRRSSEDIRNELRSYYNELTSMKYVSLLAERLRLNEDPTIIGQATKIRGEHPEVSQEQIVNDLLQTQIQSNVTVEMAAQDHIVIKVLSTDPRKAQQISTNLGEIFVQEKLKQDISNLRSSQDFSDDQLQKYETMLQSKINEKTAFEKRLLGVQTDASILSETNRLDIQSEIDQANNDISDQQKKERDMLAAISRSTNGKLSTANLTLRESPEVTDATTELRDQLQNISDYMTRYPWSDPQVLNLKLKINSLINTIEAEHRRLVNAQFTDYDAATRENLTTLFNARTNLDVLYSKSLFLKTALGELTDRSKLGPDYQATLNRLNQEIVSLTDLRNRFKSQQESSSISQALLQDMSTSKYRVVEPGKLPLAPVKPDRIKILAMGLALGLMIGGATAIIMELLDTSFKKVEDIEEHLGLPVLGIAPKVEFISKVK
ncbi:MAG: Wzz/FepE/Etk N-terminal domain-containing protein [candidate division Zixibacteria bacterium]|nr:Wzz/FepE/Etk N-terminal domain-containing protein [candidate division Zixibacteria bacterium]